MIICVSQILHTNTSTGNKMLYIYKINFYNKERYKLQFLVTCTPTMPPIQVSCHGKIKGLFKVDIETLCFFSKLFNNNATHLTLFNSLIIFMHISFCSLLFQLKKTGVGEIKKKIVTIVKQVPILYIKPHF